MAAQAPTSVPEVQAESTQQVRLAGAGTGQMLQQLPLAVAGWIVALYHCLLYWGMIPKDLVPCGEGASCTDVKAVLFGTVSVPLLSMSAFSLVVVFLSVWFLKRLAYSPFGLILRCIQQNPNRVRFIGRSVKMNQLRIYVISSFFAALAGTLMAGVDNSIHTDMLYWTTSGEVILMSVLGGINQFFGPFIGAVILILLEDIIGAKTEYWPIFLGTIIMVFVIALPRGVVGELRHIKHRLKGTDEPGGGHETHAAA